MKHRIIGLDLARAYAIFGMYVVNFNFCFGSFADKTPLGRALNLFTGNSTAIFIVCAGMGVSLMTRRALEGSAADRRAVKSIVLKRSWLLFTIGLLLYNWWPGDILHFYGGYMHIAAFMLFVPRQYLLLGAALAIAVFHLLLTVIPVSKGWDVATFRYADFWTVQGFLRNTFYNGWNSMAPWIAYFFLGMWLGRVSWQKAATIRGIFLVALALFIGVGALRKYALAKPLDRKMLDYIMPDYFPPYLPFMVITASFAVMVIIACVWLGERWGDVHILRWLAATGRLTLTNYVLHLTVGVLIFQAISGRKYTGFLQTGPPVAPSAILIFSVLFFGASVAFSVLWSRRFKKGPLEMLMRKFAG